MKTIKDARAALASAPVAGEARSIGYIDYKGRNEGHARVVLTTGYDEHGNSWPEGTKIYAAPQASAEDEEYRAAVSRIADVARDLPGRDDVRNAALEDAARICDAEGQEWDSDAVITEKNYAEHCARRIRALKQPPADKDGGQQPKRYVVLKASGRRYAYVNDTQEGRSINRFDVLKGDGWRYAHEFADRMNNEHARAALSPTQPTKDGGANG
ncbi:hypothetical protein [Achromobacter ruhlandii]|uniref:hypothetical protein n=1 Tax=Achromobacter ruhlandii TaxID=72557 RepID=UPI003B9F62A8